METHDHRTNADRLAMIAKREADRSDIEPEDGEKQITSQKMLVDNLFINGANCLSLAALGEESTPFGIWEQTSTHSMTRRSEVPASEQMLTKTEYCRDWVYGNCSAGDACPKIHPPRAVRRMKPCNYFLAGNCGRGENCTYSHDVPEVKKRGFSAASMRTRSTNKRKNEEEELTISKKSKNKVGELNMLDYHLVPDTDNELWIAEPQNMSEEKTKVNRKLCRKFYRDGKCPRNTKCCYSHDFNRNEVIANSQCLKWLEANCEKGDACESVHALVPAIRASGFEPESLSFRAREPGMIYVSSKQILMNNAGNVKSIFSQSNVAVNHPFAVEITNFEFVASYNWIKRSGDGIYIPGAPAKWEQPRLPLQVPADNDDSYLDEKAARSNANLIKAVRTMNEEFPLPSIDLVTERNSLCKLFDFVSGRASKNWRIDVDICGDTMFFTQWDNAPKEDTDSHYGHRFQQACTNYGRDLGDSRGHYRIIKYMIGGMACLVRYKGDGYAEEALPMGSALTVQQPELFPWHKDLLIDKSGPMGKVISKGYLVPNAAIIKLKPLSSDQPLISHHDYPQLWFSQSKHLFIGTHQNGNVSSIQKIYLSEHFREWQRDNQDDLNKLVELINRIKFFVKGIKNGRAMLVWGEEVKNLTLFERKGVGIQFPAGVKKHYWEDYK